MFGERFCGLVLWKKILTIFFYKFYNKNIFHFMYMYRFHNVDIYSKNQIIIVFQMTNVFWRKTQYFELISRNWNKTTT